MQENTNKTIVINSIILYARLIIITCCSLLTVRFALKALGIVDYGLFSMLASIISFIGVINTIMAGTARRFIAVAIGKNDLNEANQQFNVNFIILVAIAFFFLIFSIPIGQCYIYNYLNYDGSLNTAFSVYCICLVGSAISFAGTAYHGLLTAKENFLVFSIADIVSQLLKLLCSVLLIYLFDNKLIIYAFMMAILTAGPMLFYMFYCRKKYYDIAKFCLIKSPSAYLNVLNFAKWNSFGVVACVAKDQGTGILFNAFFNTLLNAALGIANSINGFITMFSLNLTNPISPQITKSYVSGDFERATSLLIMCTKLSFMVMYVMSVPILVETDFVLNLWLDEVPVYAVLFTQLLVIEKLIDSVNSGIAEIVFANGNISFYQLTTNSVRILAIVVGFILLYIGYPAYTLLLSYIASAVWVVIFKHISLGRIPNINHKIIHKKSYIPILKVILLTFPIFIINFKTSVLLNLFIKEIYILTIVFFIGFNKSEQNKLILLIKRFLPR